MTEDREQLEAIAARLREERPQADALELDRIKLRALKARKGAGRAWLPEAINRYGKGTLMTSRIAITILLALGIMMSGAGAALAVSGLADDGVGAAQVQYPEEQDEEGSDEQEVLGESASGGEAQADEQAAAADENLAFTGFAAIPLLLLGVGLFSAGVVMRRRTRSGSE